MMSEINDGDTEVLTQLSNGKQPSLVKTILNSNYGILDEECSSHHDLHHAHNHSHGPVEHEDRGERRLKIASVLCLIFVICEFAAGFIAKSTAVQADAAHLLTDLLSFLISLFALKLSKRPISKSYTYGWARAEVIGALFSIVTLWVISGILGYISVQRIITPEFDINANIMICISSAAIVFNIILAIVFHVGGGHGHSHHGQSHGHSHGGDGHAVNIKAALVHVFGDLVQSVGVLIAGIIVKLGEGENMPNAALADPICTLVFIIIVVITTGKIVYELIGILIVSIDPKITETAEKTIFEYTELIDELKLWCLVPGKYVLTCKLRLTDSTKISEIERCLKENIHGLEFVTIQLGESDLHTQAE